MKIRCKKTYQFVRKPLLSSLGCLLLWLSLADFSPIYAQTNTPNYLQLSGLTDSFLQEEAKKLFSQAKDSLEIQLVAQKWVESAQAQGWQASTLDHFELRPDSLVLTFYQGPRYFLANLEFTGEFPLSQDSDLQLYVRKRPPLDWKRLEDKLAESLKGDSQGYALSSLKLKNVSYQSPEKDIVEASITYEWDSGPRITVDSLQVSGEVREELSFIYAFLGIEKEMPFTQDLIPEIRQRIENSPYFNMDSLPYVKISPTNKATIHLPLSNKNNSRFDILLGILQQPSENDLSLQITGSADVTLFSPFKRGERFTFLYQKLTTTSQSLFAELAVPYLLGTNFQVEGAFDIRNQEEQFLVRTFHAALSYQFSPSVSARISVNNRSSSLLDSTVNSLATLPPLLDGVQRSVGTGFRLNELDYVWNPRKGLVADVLLSVGDREIRQNALIDASTYEGLEEKQNLLELNSHVSFFQPLGGRHVLHLANRTYWLKQDTYFLNDLLQVGGARTLRGFNENEFFTNLYSRFSLEYRLLLEKNSFMYTFLDYAYLENQVTQEYLRPLGIGIGMNYETKAGIISISYAAGRTEKQDFQPARGKIHIGFINQF
ncbi:MAG: hypothetical protein AAFR66_23355 [Bacteroidota bacterium]